MSVRSTSGPIPGCDREPAVVGGLVEEHAIVASAGFHQTEALKDADRALVGIQGLSPDLLQAELVEAIVKTCSPRPSPEPPAPAATLADGEPELASVGFFSVEVDVADEEAFVDRP